MPSIRTATERDDVDGEAQDEFDNETIDQDDTGESSFTVSNVVDKKSQLLRAAQAQIT